MITEVRVDDIPQSRKVGMVKACAEDTLAEFLESGFDACEVDPPDGVKKNSLAPAKSMLARSRRLDVKVVTRKGRVYLVRGGAHV